jgi:hypothetical protein
MYNKKELRKLKDSYKWQKWYSTTRVDRFGNPIKWELTFDSWLKIWEESGKLQNKGTKTGGYVMSRIGDIGPYSTENVRIILHSDNIKERFEYWKMSDEDKLHLSKINKGKTASIKTKEKLSLAQRKRWKNNPIVKIECPHCKKVVDKRSHWHFDRCREK